MICTHFLCIISLFSDDIGNNILPDSTTPSTTSQASNNQPKQKTSEASETSSNTTTSSLLHPCTCVPRPHPSLPHLHARPYQHQHQPSCRQRSGAQSIMTSTPSTSCRFINHPPILPRQLPRPTDFNSSVLMRLADSMRGQEISVSSGGAAARATGPSLVSHDSQVG